MNESHRRQQNGWILDDMISITVSRNYDSVDFEVRLHRKRHDIVSSPGYLGKVIKKLL